MTPLNPRLLAHGNPGLLDEPRAVRGLVIGVLLSLPLWAAIGGVVQLVWGVL